MVARKKKVSTLKTRPRKYAAKYGMRKGSKQYNAYVYGTAARRFAAKYKRRHR